MSFKVFPALKLGKKGNEQQKSHLVVAAAELHLLVSDDDFISVQLWIT